MLNFDIYEVLRQDYQGFVEQIKSAYRDVRTEESGDQIITKIYSRKTDKLLCSRVTHKEGKQPEKYYIFEMPDSEEIQPPIPKLKLNLNSMEEVQAFFNAVTKLSKEKNND